MKCLYETEALGRYLVKNISSGSVTIITCRRTGNPLRKEVVLSFYIRQNL